jgi:hypothetical protein
MFALIFFSIFMFITLLTAHRKHLLSNRKRQYVLFHELVAYFSTQNFPVDACLPSFVFLRASFSPNAGPQRYKTVPASCDPVFFWMVQLIGSRLKILVVFGPEKGARGRAPYPF